MKVPRFLHLFMCITPLLIGDEIPANFVQTCNVRYNITGSYLQLENYFIVKFSPVHSEKS